MTSKKPTLADFQKKIQDLAMAGEEIPQELLDEMVQAQLGGMMESGEMNAMEDEPDYLLALERESDPRVLWGLFAASSASARFELLLDSLPTGTDESDALELLENDWGIESKGDVLEVLTWLVTEGHRAKYNASLQIAKKPEAERAALIEKENAKYANEEDFDPEDVQDRVEGLAEGIFDKSLDDIDENKEAFKEMKKVKSLDCWDYVRAIQVCRMAFDAGLLPEKEAREKMLDFSELLKATYKSFREINASYITASIAFSSSEVYTAVYPLDVLIREEESLWKLLPY